MDIDDRKNGLSLRRPCAALLLALAVLPPPAGAQPLRRNLTDYVILAMRSAHLKDIALNGPCNIGVNCADLGNPQSSCGTANLDAATMADGSQLAANEVNFFKSGAILWQLFRNGGGSLAGVTINDPPVQTFAPPILPGTCSDACVPNVAAVEALCGFPSPFPACDPSRDVAASANEDCSAFDVVPGNGQCDLAPGTYGDLDARNGSTVALAGGAYVFCDVGISRNVQVLAKGVTVDIPSPGGLGINSGSQIGQECGAASLAVHVQGDRVSFGRNARISAAVCAPRARILLGHDNVLRGQFVGDVVNADFKNTAECCGGRCSCFDDFTPTSAAVGQTVHMESQCNLLTVTAVRVCGIVATITSQTVNAIDFTVPGGASGSCPVAVDSPAGTFVHDDPLVVP